MEAHSLTLSGILDGNRILEIPFFQRAYVWAEPQWERFLDDMATVSSEKTPYFLGSIILKQQMTGTQRHGDIRTLIDGQQRLTTLCLFFKVLSLKINNSKLETIYRLRMTEQIAIKHNHNDEESFNKILNLTTLDNINTENKISAAYNFFKNNLDESIINYQTLLDNLQFVVIDLLLDEDEQKIFDTINSLGVKLTTAELLKNYFFNHDIELYEKNWKDIFETDSARKYWDIQISAGRVTRSLLELFFYSILQIKIQDPVLNLNSEDKKKYGKVEGLFDSYKEFIQKCNINRLDLIAEIKEYAQLFRDNFDVKIVKKELPANFCMERINAIIFGLENTTLIPYILFLLNNVKDQTKLEEIFNYLESYIIRRMICHENNRNYNQLFGDRFITQRLLDVASIRNYIDTQDDKINFMPSDASVMDSFHQSKLTNKQAAGILYLLETRIRPRQFHATAMLGMGSYTLEHILPKKWRNHWPALKTEAENANRDQKLLTLGNLTIITAVFNSSISDATWDIKKDGDGKNKGFSVYAADLATFSPYLSNKSWDEAAIETRASDLAKLAIAEWKV
ncbi:hypothetical protein AGMMS49944_00100 [Spirochaetia bacterium]|nr:hypothetical protein AGMMS49944_00100 [Spirochaetia bacterium]